MARLSYDTTEKDLEREFGRFGPIERVCQTFEVCFAPHTNIPIQIRIVTNTHLDDDEEVGSAKKKKKKHRGYAFVVYEREKDMKGIVFHQYYFLHLINSNHDPSVRFVYFVYCLADL